MSENFFDSVFEIVRKIPKGMVMSYGDVALAVGRPRAARAVGGALHRNNEPVITPCHRVVFQNGALTDGYAFGGKDRQRELLQAEDVVFLPDGRVDMRACRFFPK